MPLINIVAETKISRSPRCQQLEAMFDVPSAEVSRLEWSGDLAIENKEWNVGAIIGPSGCGKSLMLNDVFGKPAEMEWNGDAVLDDFDETLSMETISQTCQAVGFNTIPAWMRPFNVLSNGEKFRVELARRLLELPSPIAVDEFTSVVDRQVAKVGSHAVQKYVRKTNKQLVVAACHYDIIDWLQPDWVYEPATSSFQWRSLRQRPELQITIEKVDRSLWQVFAPFHYLTHHVHRGAKFYALFAGDVPVSIAAMMRRPHPKAKNVMGISRLVTLPDWQGLGLSFILVEKLGMAYRSIGERLRAYPAHPAVVRSFQRSPQWKQAKQAGTYSPRVAASSSVKAKNKCGSLGGRPNATFEYVGERLPDRKQARKFINGE